MKRTIRRTVRGSINAYIGGRFHACLGHAFDPATEERAIAFLNGEDNV